jgi:hypothetical protein
VDEQTKGDDQRRHVCQAVHRRASALAKRELDAVDNQRLAYLQQNMNNLPSQVAGAQSGGLTALHEEQKALLAEQGRLRDLAQRLSQSAWRYHEELRAGNRSQRLKTLPIRKLLRHGQNS